ncbi:MAG: hypothetical protein A3C36_05995 [Omnitrophica WOR_2 bacterium RIFCSPHIGHO2_02_FULL_52_10]|nr:MAG: hypothetical protein A3C36_05995 [Omnitrophica WOR_2 bacterium RIFCSPHIGHO2_02_FULL_52_10]
MFNKIAAFLGIRNARRDNVNTQTILIVDDNPTDLALIKKTVEKLGHRAVTAVNGSEGYEIARTQLPDLILSDCRMPEMDGVAMCRLLKDDETTKAIPIVFLTGVDSPKTVIDCFDLGVNNYLCKPIRPKLLTAQIETIFKECLAA